jgi:ElaB/YqjD/DUF883 family membrane-anchored ribosome-binding protein
MEDRMSTNSTTQTRDLHPGMMGDGTEEQNLGQRGNPSARITEEEVQEAFSGASNGEDASDRWASLKERAAAVREHVANSAESVRGWAGDQASAAKRVAAEKPVLVVSASAATALAIGLGIGFVLGRATADD